MRLALLAAMGASALMSVSGARSVSAPATAWYCEPYSEVSRDLCYAVVRKRTTGTYRLLLHMGEEYFTRYSLCVRPEGAKRTCRTFPVRQMGIYSPRWGGSRSWERNYPMHGTGRYRVSWFQGGHRLGPSLTFAYVIPTYCSPSGDVCYGIFREAGAYNFRLTLAAKYFSRYRLCVRRLGGGRRCKSFPVKKTGAQWGGKVSWKRNFPQSPGRRYRVTWLRGTNRLGPPLNFTLPG